MSEKHLLYGYRAYGLNICSSFNIHYFQPQPLVNIYDVVIYEGPVPGKLDLVKNHSVMYECNESEFLFNAPDIVNILIREGKEIIVEKKIGISYQEIISYISGICFGVIAHQRSMVPMHASSVIYKNKCCLIAGMSGAGKTTLAATLIQKGAALVADDISIITTKANQSLVYPAYPFMRMWEDSMIQLDISTKKLQLVSSPLKKYYLPVVNICRTPYLISAVFFIQPENLPDPAIHQVKGIDKFLLLKRFTYLHKSTRKTQIENLQFHILNTLANDSILYMIRRPRNVFSNEQISEIIARQLDDLPKIK